LQPGQFYVFVNRNVNNLTATPVTNVPWNDQLATKLYPNPASSDFTIEIYLPQSSNVNVDLYNTLGQYVTNLYNGFMVKGTHQLPLKRKLVLSGNYYARITTKSATKTIQVTLQ
jgi:1,4-alpha-glucan branching enzyme